MLKLDREGVFQAIPNQWAIQPAKDTQSVAVAVEFKILAERIEGGEWSSWENYTDVSVWGYFYIIKKDGGINDKAVETLVESIGWDGNISTVHNELPPEVPCQITVSTNVWQGKTSYKVQWLNPMNSGPSASKAPDDDVKSIDARYGSLLRAAASATKPAKVPPPVEPPVEDNSVGANEDSSDLPF